MSQDSTVTTRVGIGWRQPHYGELLERRPALGFVEVHSENFFGDGGAALAVLERGREHYPVSLHGVGLALGSAVGLDPWHLDRLAALVQRIEPVRVSDHASSPARRCSAGRPAVHGADLLPIAFTPASLDIMVRNVEQVQQRLRRPIAVENLSAYLRWADDSLDEAQFFNELARRSGCGAAARSEQPGGQCDQPRRRAGGRGLPLRRCDRRAARRPRSTWPASMRAGPSSIDDHGSRVHEPVWQVFAHAIARLGAEADVDRVGHRHSGARRAAGRSAACAVADAAVAASEHVA